MRIGAAQKLVRSVLFYVLLTCLVAFVWYTLGVREPSAYHKDIGYQSLLAFLTMSCAAAILLEHRHGCQNANPLLHIPFIFLSLTHISAAIAILFTESALMDTRPIILLGEICKLLLFGILLLVAFSRAREVYSKLSLLRRIGITMIILSLALIIETALYFLVLPTFSPSHYTIIGAVGLIGAVLAFAGAARLWWNLLGPTSEQEHVLMLAAMTTLAFSPIPLFAAISSESILWILSLTMQAAAFLLILFHIEIPLLKGFGFGNVATYGFVCSQVSPILVPFHVIIMIDSVTESVREYSIDLYLISHIGAAILAAAMGILIYEHSKHKPSATKGSLLLLFLTWTTIEVYFVAVALSPFVLFLGESIVPHIVGSFIILIALIQGIRWTSNPPSLVSSLLGRKLAIYGFVGVSSLLALGELTRTILIVSHPIFEDNPLDNSLLFLLNLLAMFAFTYLGLLLASKSDGSITVEIISVILLSLWIVPNLLKANYAAWTSGWWASEYLGMFSLLAGPPVIGFLYLRAMAKSEKLQKDAALFQDVLVHDIGNYHQAILTALDLLEMEESRDDVQESILRAARTELLRADSLVRNVRRLGKIGQIRRENLFPVDLASTIDEAIHHLRGNLKSHDATVLFEGEKETYFVSANDLLLDVFVNLIQNALQNSPDDKRVIVRIHHKVEDGVRFLITSVEDYGKGIEPDRREQLFTRYMAGSRGSGLGLSVVDALAKSCGGRVWMESRNPLDHADGSIFHVALPATSPLHYVKSFVDKGFERVIHAMITGLSPVGIIGSELQERYAMQAIQTFGKHRGTIEVGQYPEDYSDPLCNGVFHIDSSVGDEVPPWFVVLNIPEGEVKGGTPCKYCLGTLEEYDPTSSESFSLVSGEIDELLDRAKELELIFSLDTSKIDDALREWNQELTYTKRHIIYDIILARSKLGRFLRAAADFTSPQILASIDDHLICLDNRVLPISRIGLNEEVLLEKTETTMQTLLGGDVLNRIRFEAFRV